MNKSFTLYSTLFVVICILSLFHNITAHEWLSQTYPNQSESTIHFSGRWDWNDQAQEIVYRGPVNLPDDVVISTVNLYFYRADDHKLIKSMQLDIENNSYRGPLSLPKSETTQIYFRGTIIHNRSIETLAIDDYYSRLRIFFNEITSDFTIYHKSVQPVLIKTPQITFGRLSSNSTSPYWLRIYDEDFSTLINDTDIVSQFSLNWVGLQRWTLTSDVKPSTRCQINGIQVNWQTDGDQQLIFRIPENIQKDIFSKRHGHFDLNCNSDIHFISPVPLDPLPPSLPSLLALNVQTQSSLFGISYSTRIAIDETALDKAVIAYPPSLTSSESIYSEQDGIMSCTFFYTLATVHEYFTVRGSPDTIRAIWDGYTGDAPIMIAIHSAQSRQGYNYRTMTKTGKKEKPQQRVISLPSLPITSIDSTADDDEPIFYSDTIKLSRFLYRKNVLEHKPQFGITMSIPIRSMNVYDRTAPRCGIEWTHYSQESTKHDTNGIAQPVTFRQLLMPQVDPKVYIKTTIDINVTSTSTIRLKLKNNKESPVSLTQIRVAFPLQLNTLVPTYPSANGLDHRCEFTSTDPLSSHVSIHSVSLSDGALTLIFDFGSTGKVIALSDYTVSCSGVKYMRRTYTTDDVRSVAPQYDKMNVASTSNQAEEENSVDIINNEIESKQSSIIDNTTTTTTTTSIEDNHLDDSDDGYVIPLNTFNTQGYVDFEPTILQIAEDILVLDISDDTGHIYRSSFKFMTKNILDTGDISLFLAIIARVVLVIMILTVGILAYYQATAHAPSPSDKNKTAEEDHESSLSPSDSTNNLLVAQVDNTNDNNNNIGIILPSDEMSINSDSKKGSYIPPVILDNTTTTTTTRGASYNPSIPSSSSP